VQLGLDDVDDASMFTGEPSVQILKETFFAAVCRFVATMMRAARLQEGVGDEGACSAHLAQQQLDLYGGLDTLIVDVVGANGYVG
jgi:hypothetical protein